MTTDVQPTYPVTLAATALSTLDTRDFYRHMGDINTAYNEATAAFEAAQENLLVLLTEQVARHVQGTHPDAAMLFVRAAAEYHEDAHGERVDSCEGHNHRLVPFEVFDEDGATLGGFDLNSPLFYLLERLSPMLGVEDQVLDLDARDWALDCTND